MPLRRSRSSEPRLEEWITKLRDRGTAARIIERIVRLSRGNTGQSRSVGEGIVELKLDFGPGYRVYYTNRGAQLVVLLCGGDKSTQAKDIAKAKALARDWKSGEKMTKTAPFDPADYLTSDEMIAEFLTSSLESEDSPTIRAALRTVALARGGLTPGVGAADGGWSESVG